MSKVNTLYGEMDESELVKKEPVTEVNGNTIQATEYYLGDELVHRSINITLSPLSLAGEQATLGA